MAKRSFRTGFAMEIPQKLNYSSIIYPESFTQIMSGDWIAGFCGGRSPIVSDDSLHSLNSMMTGNIVPLTEVDWVEGSRKILIF
jgi:hypothetical protein